MAQVTLDEVARKSGVSAATASRALNGRPGVRDEVRERVAIVASALGYRPNRSAQNLASGQTSVVGLMLGRRRLSTNPYATALVDSVATAAQEFDQGLMLVMDSGGTNEAARKLVGDGIVDGVIISVLALRERWIERMLDAELPLVLVGSYSQRSDVCVVDTENFESSARVVGHLLDTGCRRVAMITGSPIFADAAARFNGYRTAFARRGLDVDESLIFSGDFQRQPAYEMTGEVLRVEPDGIFAANDNMAYGLLRGITEAGLSVPEDVAVAGFDGMAVGHGWNPDLTTVVQDFDAIGRTAVSTLMDLVAGQKPAQSQLIQPSLHFGSTTR